MFASGSQDKCLKVWRRKQDANILSLNDQEDVDMIEHYDKEQIDKNQDFYGDDDRQEGLQLLNQMNNQQEEVKQSQIAGQPRANTAQNFNSNSLQNYMSNPNSQQSKFEQRRREKRLQDNQRRQFKENNYQI